jgi:PAS domain-containing protein
MMIENSASAIATWSVDLSNRQVIRSENHDSLFGYDENLPFWNIEHFLTHVHPSDVGVFTSKFRDAIQHNQNFDFEFRVMWPDGEEHCLRSKGEVIFAGDGSPISVVGSTELTV